MFAVELPLGSVHGEFEPAVAAHAEHDLRSARRVHRPVADQPEVGPEIVSEELHVLAQMGRTGLLLALEEEDEFGLSVDRRRCERIDGGEERGEWRLVV